MNTRQTKILRGKWKKHKSQTFIKEKHTICYMFLHSRITFCRRNKDTSSCANKRKKKAES